uniref:Nuclear protein 1b n=1 Tax=Xiphophorus maculatus TaxID=8083 RepID=M4A916_XIPMA
KSQEMEGITMFEEEHYDEYDRYNLTDKYGSARKGRTKKEASDNTNRQNPAGHERKIVEKLQNSTSSCSWKQHLDGFQINAARHTK